MSTHRFGPNFRRLFIAAIFQELSFSLLIHMPGYLSDLGATEGLIGLLYAASAVASLALRPMFGRILDLTHRRTVILVVGVANMGVLVALLTTSKWGPYLWVLFLAQRVLQIALFTTALTYGADTIPVSHRTQGLAIFGLSGLIPIAVGGYLGDVVIGSAGFSGLFLFSAVSSLVSWLVFWTMPVLPVRGRQPRRGYWAAVTQRDLLPLWFVGLLFTIGLESLFTFARTYVDERQIGTAGLFFAVYGVSAALTRIIGGNRYDRIPHGPILITSIAVYGVGHGLMAVGNSVAFLVAAAFLTGAAHGIAFPLISSEVVTRARISERGSAMSIFTSLFDVALLLGAPAVGFLIDGFNYFVAFSFTAAILGVGAVVYGIWDRRLAAASALVSEESLE